MTKTNIFVVGIGGQGSLVASKIIATASMKAGQKALVSEIHGMAQRGGVVSSTVKIGNVHSPIIMDGDADIIIGFEISETLRALKKASKKTIILTSNNSIIPITVSLGKGEYPNPEKALSEIKKTGKDVFAFPLVDLAKKAGNIITANTIMMGVLGGKNILPFDEKYLKEAMEEIVPDHSLKVNRKAYEIGRNAVTKGVN